MTVAHAFNDKSLKVGLRNRSKKTNNKGRGGIYWLYRSLPLI